MSPYANIDPALQPAVYKLDPARFAEYRRNYLIRLAIIVPLMSVLVFYLIGHFEARAVLQFFFVMPVLMVWFAYSQIRNQQKKWHPLAFEFQGGRLIRRLDEYPTVELMPSEVIAILESPRGILVETNERFKNLFLSNKLMDFVALRSRLLAWAPAVKTIGWRRSFWGGIRNISETLAAMCVFGGSFYLMHTSRRALILPLGSIIALAILGMILYIRDSPAIPTRSRNGLWILLLLPILPMLFRLFEG